MAAIVSDTAPSAPNPGQLWFDSSSPQLYLWYSDPNSSQWVIATANAGGLSADAPVDGNVYGRSNAVWTPTLPLSGGSGSPMSGHIFMGNHGIYDVTGINSYGYAPLPFANPIQTAGYQFWPPAGTITFSGAGQPFIDVNANYAGTLTGGALLSANRIVTSNDVVQAPVNNSLCWWSVSGNVGAATGDRAAMYALLTATATSGDVAAGRAFGPAYVAIAGSVQMNANQGGTNLTTASAGGAYGANILANLGAGATNIGSLIGTEVSVEAAAGSSVKNKVGLQIVQTSNDAVSATNGDEIGILIANQQPQGSSPGWQVGISFGSPSAAFPVKTGGTFISAGTNSGSRNAAFGIDLRNVIFSQQSLWLPGFTVAGNNVADSAMNRLSIIPGVTSATDVVFQQSGTGQFQFNKNVVTSGWLIANNDASYLAVGASNAIRMNTNGGTQPEIEVVGSAKLFFLASGGFQFNGPFGIGVAPIAVQNITGSRGGNAALGNFLNAMAAYGFITNSTTA